MDIEEIHDASIFLFVNFDIPFYRITIYICSEHECRLLEVKNLEIIIGTYIIHLLSTKTKC
jgi:hypothetical protein